MSRLRLGDGSWLAFEEHGPRAGPALLMLHGFTGSSRSWGEAVVRELATRYRLIVPDLPGHGASSREPDAGRFALERLTDELCALLDDRGIERATWLGYSMGGRIALGAGVLHPERVAALVLESTSPGIDDPTERAQRVRADRELAARIETEGLERFVDAWMAQPLFSTQARLAPATRHEQRELRLRNDPASLAACLRGVGTGVQPSFWKHLGALRVPALLIAGALDAKFVALAERMYRALPDARFAPICDAGHAVHLEQPAAYLGAVHAFLRERLVSSTPPRDTRWKEIAP